MSWVPGGMAWVSRCLGAVRRDTRGSMALMGAVAIAAVLIAVAGGLQLSQRVSTYQIAQDALDQAALFAASSSTNDDAALRSIADTAFAASLANTPAAGARITDFNYDSGDRVINMTATGSYVDALSKVLTLGSPTFQVKNQTRRRGYTSLELVLVLDTTFSMSEPAVPGDPAKIDVLRGAASSLVNTVLAIQSSANIKIGVVPYTEKVNVGKYTRDSWLTVPNSVDYCQVNNKYVTPENCVPTLHPTLSCPLVTGPCPLQTDGVAYTGTCKTRAATCPDSEKVQETDQPVKWTLSFQGCVSALANGNTLLMPDPGIPYVGRLTDGVQCPEQIQPLTTSQSLVQSAITGLYVTNNFNYRGNTYIPIGLVWGVNVLSSPAPYTEGLAYDPQNRSPHKVLILMTDGQNDYALGTDGEVAAPKTSADLTRTYADQIAVCNYAKARAVEIYAIGFGVDDSTQAGAQSLSALRSCATDSSHYFDANDAAALRADFAAIAYRLSVVRISQ